MRSEAAKPPFDPSTITVLLVDDHEFVRIGLRQVLLGRKVAREVLEASDVPTALLLLKTHDITLALIDISLPGRSGLDLLREIRARAYPVRAIMLSMHERSLYWPEARAAGAVGYVMKHQAAEVIAQAVTDVLAGRVYALPAETPGSTGMRTTENAAPEGSAYALSRVLTPRERELLRLFGQGLTTTQIAAIVSRSVKTVEAHRANLKIKLRTPSLAEFLRLAVLLTSTDLVGLDTGTGATRQIQENP